MSFRIMSATMLLALAVMVARLPAAATAAPSPTTRLDSLPPNTWVRLADCPGDELGREVPPGRAAKWCYVPPMNAFIRFGGYTPRFSNAMDAFDPASGKWTRLFAEDENYPTDRPGGACESLVQYDAKRNCVWIAGGFSTAASGQLGVWKYDLAKKEFTKVTDWPRGAGRRVGFDPANGVFVVSPGASSDGNPGLTWVMPIDSGKWQQKPTKTLPQNVYAGNFPLIFDEAHGKLLLVGVVKDKMETWTFDAASFQWEQVATGGPGNRAVFALAYDPSVKKVMLYGGSDGQYGEYYSDGKGKVWNDTWHFDLDKKEWAEVKTAGPTPLSSPRRGKMMAELTYRLALAYDSDHRCMMMCDPDLGVWAFRCDPTAPPGAEALSYGFVSAVGAAAKNPPADGPKEVVRKFPSPLNPKLVDLAENTLVQLGGGIHGWEISWTYDPDAGVFVKYGGCGNGSSPYWAHYGNDLGFYDPGTETFCSRRVGDVSGADRPHNGCTRTVAYDVKRKVHWFFGTTDSGPSCPAPPHPALGYYQYDVMTDLFKFTPITVTAKDREQAFNGMFQNCYMARDPDRDLAIWPDNKKTHLFHFDTGAWEWKDSPDCPGGMTSVYQVMPYVASKKSFFRLVNTASGKTSAEKPADALPPEQAAGKTNLWREDKARKQWREFVCKTYLYDPAANTWTDMNPPANPPYRDCKYGMAYDSKHDVVILVGGEIDWNGPSCADMWAYDVQKNTWTKLQPQYQDPKAKVNFRENLMTGYDTRHNVVVFRSSGAMWAYRYAK